MRAGPAGRTAAERNSSDRDASRIQVGPSMGDLCPEELTVLAEVKAAGKYISPSRLHAMYVRFIENAQTDWDFGGYVLTFIRGGEVSRSVPVDPMAERIARRMAGRVA